jgi:spore protease
MCVPGRDDNKQSELGCELEWKLDEYSPRTDLAVEAHEIARNRKRSRRRVAGVEEQREQFDGIEVARVQVKTKAGEQAIGKRVGTYVTLEAQGLRRRDPELQDRMVEHFAAEFETLLDIPEHAKVLIVGLGNEHVTPDALGPKVAERVFVTRHLFEYMPELLDQGYRTVSAVAPGVLGITGIETSEIVKGIVDNVQPDAVIAIDALASRSLSRVNSTIQISDTGIQPGAGVGNKRKSLDESYLGCKVYAIGVPTVVDAATIANDSIELVLKQLKASVPENGASQIFDQFSTKEKWQMIKEVLEPLGDNLVVTPKEIDEFIDDVAEVVAKGLNLALHPGMTMEDANALTH